MQDGNEKLCLNGITLLNEELAIVKNLGGNDL